MIDKRKTFSVVIPLYNKSDHIKETVESALAQTFQDYEIVIVDDGSTDGSLEIVKKIHSDKVRIIQQPNQGVAVARNTGIENANGEYIAFLDADDVWHPDYLKTIAELIENYPQSDIFVTAYEVLMKNGKVNMSTQLTPGKGCLESYWLTLTEKYDFVWTSATVIGRTALQKAGMFKPGEKIGQDLDMWARVARNNPRVAYSSKACVTYTRNAKENARTRVKIAWARAFLKDLEEELQNKDHTEEEMTAIQKKYDMKMTVYIFTTIMAGEKKRAWDTLHNWRGKKNKRNRMLRTGLKIAAIMPTCVNRILYKARLRLF